MTANLEKIAIIDTETNWMDEVMSVGIIIAQANTYTIIDSDYYIITPEYKSGGMYSDMLDIDNYRENIKSRDFVIGKIIELINKHNVSKIFAYNAHFDYYHLPELKEYHWYDIMKLASNKKYNKKITDEMECFSTGRLKKGYGVENILKLLSGDNCTMEVHNGLSDAIDELEIMKLLNHDIEIYEIACIN